MKKFIYLILALILLTVTANTLQAQGCVAVRNMSSVASDSSSAGAWQFSLNYRYFRSYKHFRGREEEENRVEQGTEVINKDNSVLLGIAYNVNQRWTVAAIIPYLSIDRSSLYEHYGNTPGNPRFHTQAKGFGDVRVSTYYSVLKKRKINLNVGLGVKLPTGNFHTKDNFHRLGSEGQDSLVYRVVDQSIQLGDGGFGIVGEYDVAWAFAEHFSVYSTGLYLSNPRNTNGVLRSATLTENIPLSNEFSVVDQFLVRIGARYSIRGFSFAGGIRYEGIPSEDVFGKSDGFRRPGRIVSAEPALGYTTGNHSFGVNVPIALTRNRTQNTIDKIRSKSAGTEIIGDAAFADYLVSFSYAYKLAR
jgi:hypothetical protein